MIDLDSVLPGDIDWRSRKIGQQRRRTLRAGCLPKYLSYVKEGF